MRAWVVWITVEDLLGNLEGLGGVFPHGQLPFGNHGRGTGAAQHPFEKAAAVAGFFELGAAKGFASFVEAGFPGQNLRKKIDGVIKIISR